MIITELFIPGRPATKGSLTRQGDRLVDTPQSKAWRRVMAGAIRDDLMRRHPSAAVLAPYAGPVHVTALWWMPVEPMRAGAGDVDKLLRNLLDALSAPGKRTTDASLCAGAMVDDNQVLGVESWQFCDPIAPGALVRVVTLDGDYLAGADGQHRRWRDALTA